ncbi:AAA family ATPase [Aeromicrobium stalagmiti]|uniref:AAA family ATPase n=1 Tax=Aeromicrobium stalagmiti TaxID=2738988 RepID=UPI0015689DFE|nr:P-loop NTPase [Aeromicrobium stalagmiti]NRQ48293.1 P-loop NTPase [Aeromicrobium stalagmiti]
MSRILLLGGDGGLEYRLGQFPGNLLVPIAAGVVDRSDFDIRGLMVEDHLPDIVVFGPQVSRHTAMSLASLLDAMHPQITVVLVAEPTTDVMLEAMRSGIRDVLAPDASDEEYRIMLLKAHDHASRRTVRRATEETTERVVESRVVVVASPKGGVGKSTIAVNMAVGLARRAPMDVVLVDLDLQFGDVATHLDLKPAHSLADVFANQGGLDTLLLKTFLTAHPAGFYALCGSESPAAADKVGPKQVRELLSSLASQFRYVIVDTGAGLDEPTLAALEEANDAVFVSSMDVASVRNIRKEIEVLATLNILPGMRHLVLNFADRQSGLSVRDVEAVVGLPVNVVVPRAPEVSLSANRGVPVLMEKKGGPAAKAMNNVVKRLEGESTSKKPSFAHKGLALS